MVKLFKRLMSIVTAMAQRQQRQTQGLSQILAGIKDIQTLLKDQGANLSKLARALSTMAPKTTAASVPPQATTTLASGK